MQCFSSSVIVFRNQGLSSQHQGVVQGYFTFCNLVDKVFTVDNVMTVEANKRFHNLSKELGSIVHHATNA